MRRYAVRTPHTHKTQSSGGRQENKKSCISLHQIAIWSSSILLSFHSVCHYASCAPLCARLKIHQSVAVDVFLAWRNQPCKTSLLLIELSSVLSHRPPPLPSGRGLTPAANLNVTRVVCKTTVLSCQRIKFRHGIARALSSNQHYTKVVDLKVRKKYVKA